MYAVQDVKGLCLGLHDIQQKESWVSFQVSQGCRGVCSWYYV